MRQEKLIDYKVDGQKVTLNFEGKMVWIEVVTPQIIRVYEEGVVRSKAIEGEKSVPCTLSVCRQEDGLWLDTGEVLVRISDGFYIDFLDKNREMVCEDYRGERTPLIRGGEELEELLLDRKSVV